MQTFFSKYGFLLGLVLVFGATLADTTGTLAAAGRWLKLHRGPDVVVVLIFFFSGLGLSFSALAEGLKDTGGVAMALVTIFATAPLIAAGLSLLPLDKGIIIGLFLVAVMPTTLSSGVVMTAVAGGNMAHALLITILANSLAVFTIPVTLSWLLPLVGDVGPVAIDKSGMMQRIAFLVLVPLLAGLVVKIGVPAAVRRGAPKFPVVSQGLVLTIVWMAVSQARPVILESGRTLVIGFLAVFVLHGALLGAGGLMTFISGRTKGQRESIILMGGQKTLPLAVLLQVSLFPHYISALVVCVVHHIVHLMMDAYLVAKWRR